MIRTPYIRSPAKPRVKARLDLNVIRSNPAFADDDAHFELAGLQPRSTALRDRLFSDESHAAGRYLL
jgi:hypothetical protein